MSPKEIILTLLLGASFLCLAHSAHAQRNVPYYPVRPPLSPYLRIFQGVPAGVDNYHAFVRPELELREALRRQQRAMGTQGASVLSLERRTSRIEAAGSRGRGTPGGYMNYLHYYPGPNSLISPRAGRGRY